MVEEAVQLCLVSSTLLEIHVMSTKLFHNNTTIFFKYRSRDKMRTESLSSSVRYTLNFIYNTLYQTKSTSYDVLLVAREQQFTLTQTTDYNHTRAHKKQDTTTVWQVVASYPAFTGGGKNTWFQPFAHV